MNIWRRHIVEGCKWLLLFLSVQALGDPTFNYIKLLDKEATRQSGVSKNYVEMVDKYVIGFSFTRLPRDVAQFPDGNIFLYVRNRSHRDKQVCRFNAGACDEVHGGKIQCYCKKVMGHEYHFIANCTARLEDASLFLVAMWQNNQQTTNVTSDWMPLSFIMKYPEDDIFYSSTVTEHNSAILVCDLKRGSHKSPPKTNVTVDALTVKKRALKDISFVPIAHYQYIPAGLYSGNPDQKHISTQILRSNGRIVATIEGKCPNGCGLGYINVPNEDLVRIVIAFKNVTCEDAGEYSCRANVLQTNRRTGETRTCSEQTAVLGIIGGKVEDILGSISPYKTAYQEDERVTFTCQTKGPSIVKIGWKYQICPTDSQPNPPIKDWDRASDILHNNQRTIKWRGCNKSKIISELKNVHLVINDQRICLIRCEAIFNGDHKKWNKYIKYVIPDIETTTLTPEQTSTTSNELGIGTTTLTPQKTKRTFNNQGRNKRCDAFKYGPKCENLCNENCAKEGLCDEDTGVCHDGCKPGFNPPDCEKRCEKGTYSVNCSKSCVNCAKNYTTGEHICEHSTGDCYFGCDEGYGGDTCEKLIVLSQVYHIFTAKNITFVSPAIKTVPKAII